MITLCCPTLNRYDLLMKCIKSAEEGMIKPDKYLIIDNGGKINRGLFLNRFPNMTIEHFGSNLGVAKSWNYFINNTDEIRIICNDDIYFYPETISKLVTGYRNDRLCCSADSGINAFSMFTISDKIAQNVGLFDEEISPNYAYYEDNDYHRRMVLSGYDIYLAPDCYCGHLGSATLKSFSKTEMDEHHSKFKIAQQNYKRKWGGLPGEERFSTPYNK